MKVNIENIEITEKEYSATVSVVEQLGKIDVWNLRNAVEQHLIEKLTPILVAKYEQQVIDSIDVEQLIRRVQLSIVSGLTRE